MLSAPDVRGAFALHEAGHAVVARELGLEVLRVELGDGVGACHVAATSRDTLSNVRRELAVLLAGWIAERIADGGDWRTLPLRRVLATEATGGRRTRVANFTNDVARLRKVADVEAFMVDAVRDAAKRAAGILKEHWPGVLDLAAQLYVDGQVDLMAA